MKPRALAVGENRRSELERVVIRLAVLWNGPSVKKAGRLRVRIFERGDARARLLGHGRRLVKDGLFLLLARIEKAVHELHRLVAVEIARDRQDREVWRVVAVVERSHPLELRIVE